MTVFRPEPSSSFPRHLHFVMVDDHARVVEKSMVGVLKIVRGRTASDAQLQVIAEQKLFTGRCELLWQDENGISCSSSFGTKLLRSL